MGAFLPRHLALTCCMLSSEQRMTVKVASPAHAHSMSRGKWAILLRVQRGTDSGRYHKGWIWSLP